MQSLVPQNQVKLQSLNGSSIPKAISCFLISTILLHAGCSKSIEFEESKNIQFLSQHVQSLADYESSLSSFSTSELNELLSIAYMEGLYESCRYLIDLGANGNFAVESQMQYREEEVLYNLIASRTFDPEDDKLIRHLISKNPELLNEAVDFDPAKPGYRTTLFHELVTNAPSDLVHYAIDMGADIESKNSLGNTPLFDAVKSSGAFQKSIEKLLIVKMLFESEADVTARNNSNSTVLHYLRWWPETDDFTEVVEHMVEMQLDVNSQDDNGNTPAHIVFTSGTFLYQDTVSLLRVLHANGADFSILNNDGESVRRSFNRATAQYRKIAPEDRAGKEDLYLKIDAIDQFLSENGFSFLSN